MLVFRGVPIMINLPAFKNQEFLYEGKKCILYRAFDTISSKPVILKLLNPENISEIDIERFRQEYRICSQFDSKYIIKTHSIIPYGDSLLIVEDDDNAISLKDYISKNRLPIKEFLNISINIVKGLQTIHTENIIHKDINPSNIIIAPKKGIVKIIDFGISSEYFREDQIIVNPEILEGTLYYMAPEQTGRMNRSIDYRADFYSLGVTMYEMLTGDIPFKSDDSLELVHAHIAREPKSPEKKRSDCPQQISNIILKLMNKNAEKRYQSARGLLFDLEESLRRIDSKNNISEFPLGSHDYSDRFNISQKLYGRDIEISELLDTYNWISKGHAECFLISGPAGSGKSSLVREIFKPITENKGIYIYGKYEQLQRTTPYRGVIEAFRNMIEQLLVESPEQIRKIKDQMLNNLGDDIEFLYQILPEISFICGNNCVSKDFSAKEQEVKTKNILAKTLESFIESTSHSLVLVLDDLHWIDTASLNFLFHIFTSTKIKNFMLIGTFRENEVSEAHPVKKTIENLKFSNIIIHEIKLKLLSKNNIEQLLSDSFSVEGKLVTELTDSLIVKTGGNPFFINEFLASLYNDGMIVYNFERSEWTWDMSRIRQQGYTDNVIELMTNNISSLPEDVSKLLKLSSAIGTTFSFDSLLVLLNETDESAVFSSLKEAISKGYLSPVSSVKSAANSSLNSTVRTLLTGYKFTHDRIQQSAYSLLDSDEKKIAHKKLAFYYLKDTKPSDRNSIIFDIVNHLNMSSDLVESNAEKYEIAKLNLEAAQKAKNSAAYDTAFNYILQSIKMINTNGWSDKYKLYVEIYINAVEISMRCGEYEKMDEFSHIAEKKFCSIFDEMKIQVLRIHSYVARNDLDRAIETSFIALKHLGINFPEKPSKAGVFFYYTKIRLLTMRLTPESIIKMKKNTNRKSLAAMEILSSVATSLYFSRPDYLPYVIFRMMEISLKYGNSPESAQAYAVYGLILSAHAGKVDEGIKFGKAALSLVNEKSAFESRAKVIMIYYSFIDHWKNSNESALPFLLQGYNYGIENGDYEFASHSAFIYCARLFYNGTNLKKTSETMQAYIDQIKRRNQKTAFLYLSVFLQTIENLRGKDNLNNPIILNGDFFNESIFSEKHSNKSVITIMNINKLTLAYFIENFEYAFELIAGIENNIAAVKSSMGFPWFYFFKGLIYAQLTNKFGISKLLKEIKTILKQLKNWSQKSPDNFEFYYLLLRAEYERLSGKRSQASKYYDRSVTKASKNKRLNEMALANELTAKFFLEIKRFNIARAFMINAEKYYTNWNATIKVKHLHENYPELLVSSANGSNSSSIEHFNTSTSGSTTSEHLDIQSVLKAAVALSEERETQSLLKKVMTIIMQNAAAQKGAIIIKKNDSFYIEAYSKDASSADISVHEELENSTLVPVNAVNYVIRTKEPMVIHDVPGSKFNKDSYFEKNSTLSSMIVPVIHHDNIIAAIYLENNIAKGAFSTRRLSIIKMIAAQAAISLQNADYYEKLTDYSKTLESKVVERTSELEGMNNSLIEIYEQLSQARIEGEQDMNMAGNVQKSFLPDDYNDKSQWDIAYIFKPMTSVSGDFYDFYEVNDELRGAGLFDVSGHGISSGLITVLARSIIYHNFSDNIERNLGEVLENINEELSEEISHSGNYLTGVLLRFNKNKIEYVNAGHPSIFIKRHNTNAQTFSKDGDEDSWRGVFLGMPFITSKYGVVETEMQSGDFILLYTDCLNESQNKDKEPYGNDRIIESMNSIESDNAQEILNKVVSDFYDFTGSRILNDDFTVMVIRKK